MTAHKRPSRVPAPVVLLERYLKAGAPVRASWLSHVHAPASKRWVVLYCRSFETDLMTDITTGEGSLMAEANAIRGVESKRHLFPGIYLRTFTFPDSDAGREFERSAMQRLVERIRAPGIVEEVSRIIDELHAANTKAIAPTPKPEPDPAVLELFNWD